MDKVMNGGLPSFLILFFWSFFCPYYIDPGFYPFFPLLFSLK